MAFNPLTSLEEATLNYIRMITANEIHVYVTEDGGTVVDVTVNHPDGGPLSAQAKILLDGGQKLRLLHNHPSGGSISSSDWKTLAEYHALLEMVVATPNGSIFRGKIDHDFQAGEMQAVVRVANDVFQSLDHMIKPPNIAAYKHSLLANASRFPTVFISQRFYELGLVDYAQYFSTADMLVIADLQQEPIRNMWSGFLRRIWA